MAWRHFQHQADIGLQGEGETLEEAFVGAATALTAVITEPAAVRADQSITIRCNAPDTELLLVDFLNAIIYEMAVRHMLFSRFDVRLEEAGLVATIWGEPLDPQRHRPAVEVKGASYTALKVGRENGRWIAQCVVDV